tara:strand:+ start:1242 stop:1604 length:363 start_codon:yes stop_codon:yes gene_type:complete
MAICCDCGTSMKHSFITNGKARCQPCDAGYSRRRFFAEKAEREKNMPDPFSQMGGLCFLCDSLAHYGVFREIARDGGKETCKTWICWPCHTSRPTLHDFVPVAPLRGVDFPSHEGLGVEE